MNYEQKFDELMKKNPTAVYSEFLKTLKSLFEDFIKGNVTDVTVSNITVDWYVNKEKFSNVLIKINPKIKELSLAMDITHPDYTQEEKVKIIKELIKKIDGMIKD